MRRTAKLLVTSVAVMILGSCAMTSQVMKERSQGARTDVFEEVGERDALPRGYALVEIQASIKTHTEGYFPFESEGSPHGKPGYPFLVNVDGQAATWKVNGHIETDAHGAAERVNEPEGGTGMRYVLRKRIRVAAGAHRIFFGLPGEGSSRQIDITLRDGRLYVLRFGPVYMPRSCYGFEPCFRRNLADRPRHFTGGLACLDFAISETSAP